MELALPAPAKVNLGLEVLARRADGFHELRSLVVSIDLSDLVILKPGQSGLDVTGAYAGDTPKQPEDNLAWRALIAIAGGDAARIAAAMQIVKRIPVAAGLGGASADAAAVLRAAPFFDAPRSRRELVESAARLGADVPFQLSGGRALVAGAGERVEPLPHLSLSIALCWTGVACSTGAVFTVCDTRGEAERLVAAAQAIGMQAWCCSTLPRMQAPQ